MTKINSLDDIVKNGLCIGCGLCKSIAGNSLEMEMSWAEPICCFWNYRRVNSQNCQPRGAVCIFYAACCVTHRLLARDLHNAAS